MDKKTKEARDKLTRRLSGRLFRYTFSLSLAMHLGIWGIFGFPKKAADAGPSGAPEKDRMIINTERVRYPDLRQPQSIEPAIPERIPPGLQGKAGVGEIPLPVPDKDADASTLADADPGTDHIGRDTRIIVVDPGADPDKPRSASPDTVEFVPYSKAPVLVKSARAKYPEIAYNSGVEGDVVLLVYVDERGDVRNAVVQSSPGLPALDEAAKSAAYACKFEPAEQQGVAVGVWYSLVMQFRL
jgi:TonB family protein